MRTTSILAVLGAALTLGACTVVDRSAPPTVVQTPAPVVQAPVVATPPTVTVRPGY